MDVTLLDDFKINLTVRNLAPRTITKYLETCEKYARWCNDGPGHARSGMTKRDVTAYLASMTTSGAAANYLVRTYQELNQLFKFLVAEEIIESNPLDKISRPAVPEQPVPLLTEEEIRRLLSVCTGRGFNDLRDTAIIRLLLDTGMRCSELIGIEIDDLDFQYRTIVITGKGRRDRVRRVRGQARRSAEALSQGPGPSSPPRTTGVVDRPEGGSH